MTLELVKGEFSSLEEALRAQVKMMDEKLFLLDQESKLDKLEIEELQKERDEWRSKYDRLREARGSSWLRGVCAQCGGLSEDCCIN